LAPRYKKRRRAIAVVQIVKHDVENMDWDWQWERLAPWVRKMLLSHGWTPYLQYERVLKVLVAEHTII
jgi:hypothetical protein